VVHFAAEWWCTLERNNHPAASYRHLLVFDMESKEETVGKTFL